MAMDTITMATMGLSPIISTIRQQVGLPASTLQTDFAVGLRLFSIETGGVPSALGQAGNSGAMELLEILPGPDRAPLSTLSTANLSMLRVTADSKAAQVQDRLVAEVMSSEVPVGPQEVGVPAAVAAEDFMAAVGFMAAVEGVNISLINGGKNSG